MNSPISWLGGKSRLRKKIVEMMPEHICYVEVFCGASWVLFEKERAKVEVMNDIDGELINFYWVVKHHHRQFIKAFDWILISREIYRKFKQADVEKLTRLERAARFYYLVKCGYANVPQAFNFGYGTCRNVGVNLRELEKIITGTYERLKTVTIENLSYEGCIPRYDRPHTLFYLDPPYYEVEPYHYKLGKEGHEKLAKTLRALKGKFILSYNEHPAVRKLYKGFKIKKTEVLYTVSRQKETQREHGELLITNF